MPQSSHVESGIRSSCGLRAAGIIAEYNPLHTGHERQLALTREKTGADYCIVVMSPDFVQRGEPAVFDKFTRTRMALAAGADLVLELPVYWACSSAEYFAGGAVRLLDKLGCVSHLCFGSETEDLFSFEAAADLLLSEPRAFKETLREKLSAGATYPAARAAAAAACLPEQKEALATLLSSPNAILGLEYIKALRQTGSRIVPVPVLREGAGYLETELGGALASAGAIRRALNSEKESGDADHSRVLPYIPAGCRSLFAEASAHPVTPEDFAPALHYLIAQEADLGDILDLPPYLADRIRNLSGELAPLSTSGMIDLLKTKSDTRAGISRALLHLLLQISASRALSFRDQGMIFYARVLGFKKTAEPLLHEIKKAGSVPLLTTPSGAEQLLSGEGRAMYRADRRASHLYRSILSQKYQIPFRAEETCPVIIQ